MDGKKEWVRTTRIVDPAVEEYETQDSGEVRKTIKENSSERDELLE